MEILSWQSGGDLVQTQILRSHTRVVSDLNWHRFDPYLLASCSIDTFIHVWDIRDQRRPSLSLSAVGKMNGPWMSGKYGCSSLVVSLFVCVSWTSCVLQAYPFMCF